VVHLAPRGPPPGHPRRRRPGLGAVPRSG
jgi:hypothetical protein